MDDVELDTSEVGSSNPPSSSRKSWVEEIAEHLRMSEERDQYGITLTMQDSNWTIYVTPITLSESSFVEIELEDIYF